jgi:hypothetical protein
MKLEGSLDAFGLPDVCTLLGSTGKSGALELSRARADELQQGVVWFKAGEITGATADVRRQNLARRLIGSGVADDVALRHAVARSVSGGSGVARALLESGSADASFVQKAAREQLADALSELLTWSTGEFSFDADAQFNDDVGVSVTVADALSVARDRHDHWSALRGVIAGPDVVLAISPGVVADPLVSREDWAVIALVDGIRTVQDLAELTGSGLYGVTTVLAGLLQRGLLTVKDPTSPDHVSTLERRLAMLGSIESGPQQTSASVSRPLAAPVPGGLGTSAAAALSTDRAFSSEGQAFTRERQPANQASFATQGNGFESSLIAPASPGHSMSAALATPGALGSQVMAAHSYSAAHALDAASAQIATAPVNYAAELIRRDPMMNRTLLLRLIAGVRGL